MKGEAVLHTTGGCYLMKSLPKDVVDKKVYTVSREFGKTLKKYLD